MTVTAFRQLTQPAALEGALAALWWDAQGDWERAHELAQEAAGPDGDWVHAYLHRKEGDLDNASYWYARAGRGRVGPEMSLADEWTAIVTALLAAGVAE